MRRHTLALFFSLALLSVTFAETGAPPGLTYKDSLGYGGSVSGSSVPGGSIRVGGGSSRGRPCKSKQPGRDCVAEGSLYTDGMSCCPPMVNPAKSIHRAECSTYPLVRTIETAASATV
ncbi:hypothetical protein [Absidia glauca]|uniref:Long chronological lifespan protein 2 n=1 Tax=Absidia glauca TaxID=4829 RepID=A0A168PQJ4_ABSGL|nr:hypothetical protein [Absidia glauca]